MRRCRIALDDVVARARAGSIGIDTLLREGSPALEIVGVADEIAADLIVMGTHGRRGVARALLGSVAEHVVRAGRAPVLTVHAQKQALPASQADETKATSSSPRSRLGADTF
jgi:nucleotide-binding universal stress UspA family protein